MKANRILALFLCLLMALPAVQTAFAATGYDGTTPVNEGWSEWKVTKEPTCTREGQRVRTSRTGRREVEVIPPKEHSYRSTGVILRQATCQARAREQLVCTVCGRSAWRPSGELAPHTWGAWTVLREPTAVNTGLRQRTCLVCGKTVEQEFSDGKVLPAVPEPGMPGVMMTAKLDEPGPFGLNDEVTIFVTITNLNDMELQLNEGSSYPDVPYPSMLAPNEVWTGPYTFVVTQAMLEEAKLYDSEYTAIFQATYTAEGKTAAATTACAVPMGESPKTNGLVLFVEVIGGAEPYLEDDVVQLEATLYNTGDTVIYDAILYDAYGMPCGHEDILPGEYHTEKFSYTVTGDDAEQGLLTLVFDACGWPDVNEAEIWAEPVTISLLTAVDNDADPYLTMSVAGGEGDFTAEAGSEITVNVTVRNEGNVPVSVVNFISQSEDGRNAQDRYDDWSSACAGVIDVEEERTFPYVISVSEPDAAEGQVHREMFAAYEWTNDTGISLLYDTNIVMVDLALEDPMETGKFVIAKECTNQPKNHKFYVENEKITYSITVENNTDETLFDVEIIDPLLKDTYPGGVIATYPSMGPGFKAVIDVEYTVKAEDIPKDVINYAMIVGLLRRERFELASNRVKRPTGVDDPPVLPEAVNSCVRTLVRHGSGTSEYTLEFCSEHQVTANAVLDLFKNAVTEEEKLNAYRKANELWRADIDSLYVLLEAAVSYDRSTAVAGSRSAWNDYLETRETAMREGLGLSETEIALQLGEELQARCVDLCYLLRNAPDHVRPDSLVTGTYEAVSFSQKSELCDLSTYVAETGAHRLVSRYCDEHSAIEQRLLNSLKAAGTAAEKTSAFGTAERAWQDGVLSRVSTLDLDAAKLRTLMQSCNAMNALLIQDSDMYVAFYPDHTETVAEILAREAREMAIRFCVK